MMTQHELCDQINCLMPGKLLSLDVACKVTHLTLDNTNIQVQNPLTRSFSMKLGMQREW